MKHLTTYAVVLAVAFSTSFPCAGWSQNKVTAQGHTVSQSTAVEASPSGLSGTLQREPEKKHRLFATRQASAPGSVSRDASPVQKERAPKEKTLRLFQGSRSRSSAAMASRKAAESFVSPLNVLQVHEPSPSGRELTPEDIAGGNLRVKLDTEAQPEMQSQNTEPLFRVISRGQKLAIHHIPTGREAVVAESDDPAVTFGVSVSRNEFGINDGVFWSPGNKYMAFYRKDESAVTDFPLLDISSRTGSLRTIKYPMNGMASEHVSLGIYHLASGSTAWLQVTDFTEERYLAGVSFSPDSKYVFVHVLDRSQHHMHLNMYRSDNGAFVRTLLEEHNLAWVEPQEPLRTIRDTYNFIYETDNRDGYHQLYRLDTLGTLKRITPCNADVQYVANDGRYLYYYSWEISPAQRNFYRVSVSGAGEAQRLTPEDGQHSVILSADFKYFMDSLSSFNLPCRKLLRSISGDLVRELGEAPDPFEEFATGRVELGIVPCADRSDNNFYRLYFPPQFDPSQKYPLLVYVYGGPHSQMVTDSWLGGIRPWEMLMAQRGFIVYVMDGRGTMHHGADYERAINGMCGQAEMEDQMVGVNALCAQPYVDETRVGVSGWSYGGFMTISLMTTYPEVFKVGACGGPVIDWNWYEVMYGERYMDTEETNPEGFALTRLQDKVEALKDSHLLICQGMMDNTVVSEHSLSFVQACVEKGVQVDYMPYPCSEHNVMGAWRAHLYQKFTDYFETYLK